MSDKPPKDPDPADAYFDDMLTDAEVESLLDSEKRELLMREKELQVRIDESLRRSFDFKAMSDSQPTAVKRNAQEHQSTSQRVNRWNQKTLIQIAVAASLLIISGIAIWQFSQRGKLGGPVFQLVPLAKIYRESIVRGFRPYYNCEDEQRFADVFEKRQGVPLRLAELPEGSKMLGISYLGGLSRETTAMLCKVNNEPVIVFVDLLTNDRPEMIPVDDADVFVFREEKFGLVFYEVTPFNSPRMIKFMVRQQ